MPTRAPHWSVKFTVPGNPVGYYAVGSKPNWTRMRAYHEYKARVQECADAALLEHGMKTPLAATKERPIIVNTVAHFESGVHCDPENVRKAITDALFYVSKGEKKLRKARESFQKARGERVVKIPSGDKHTGGSFPPPLYDSEDPRVEVEVVFVGRD